MPEVKQADAELQALQTQLEKKASKWYRIFKPNIRTYRENNQEKSHQNSLDEEAHKLKEQETEIGKFEGRHVKKNWPQNASRNCNHF